jgi:hypothetical protein
VLEAGPGELRGRLREAAGCYCLTRPALARFHFAGVTASGVPLLELIQPDAVSLHRYGSRYRAPCPSVTSRLTSSSNGAVSIGFQPKVFGSTRIVATPSILLAPLSIRREARQSL